MPIKIIRAGATLPTHIPLAINGRQALQDIFGGGQLYLFGDSEMDTRIDRVPMAIPCVWPFGRIVGIQTRMPSSSAFLPLQLWTSASASHLVNETDDDPTVTPGARFTFQSGDASKRHTMGLPLIFEEIAPGAATSAARQFTSWRTTSHSAANTIWRDGSGNTRTRNPIPFQGPTMFRLMHYSQDDPGDGDTDSGDIYDATAEPLYLRDNDNNVRCRGYDGNPNTDFIPHKAARRLYSLNEGDPNAAARGAPAAARQMYALFPDQISRNLNNDEHRVPVEIFATGGATTLPAGKWSTWGPPLVCEADAVGSGYRIPRGTIICAGGGCPSFNVQGLAANLAPDNQIGTGAGAGENNLFKRFLHTNLLHYFEATTVHRHQKPVVVIFYGDYVAQDPATNIPIFMDACRAAFRQIGRPEPRFVIFAPPLSYDVGNPPSLSAAIDQQVGRYEAYADIAQDNTHDSSMVNMAGLMGWNWGGQTNAIGSNSQDWLDANIGSAFNYGAQKTINSSTWAGKWSSTQSGYHPGAATADSDAALVWAWVMLEGLRREPDRCTMRGRARSRRRVA